MSRSWEVHFLNITIKPKWEDNSTVIFCHQHMPSDLFQTGSSFCKTTQQSKGCEDLLKFATAVMNLKEVASKMLHCPKQPKYPQHATVIVQSSTQPQIPSPSSYHTEIQATESSSNSQIHTQNRIFDMCLNLTIT